MSVIQTLSVNDRLKRRISFCGKNSVREFHHEEEPKAWQNSYEISDHLTSDETGSTLNSGQKSEIQISYNTLIMPAGSTCTSSTSVVEAIVDNQDVLPPVDGDDNKENIEMSVKITTSGDEYVSRCSKDGPELEASARLSSSLRLEQSLDITLFDSEKTTERHSGNKVRSIHKRTSDGVDTRNMISFTLCEHELNKLNHLNRSNVDREETIVFMDRPDITMITDPSSPSKDEKEKENRTEIVEVSKTATRNDNLANVTMEMSPIPNNVIPDNQKPTIETNRNENVLKDNIAIPSKEDGFAASKVIIRRVIAGTGALPKTRFRNTNCKKMIEPTIGGVQCEETQKTTRTETESAKSEKDGKLFLDQLDLSLVHPSEYDVSNLKQLNDAIERGKIQVYPDGTPRTPTLPKRAADKNRNRPHNALRRVLSFNGDSCSPIMDNCTNKSNLLKPKRIMKEQQQQEEMNISNVDDASNVLLSPRMDKYLKEQNVLDVSAILPDSKQTEEDDMNPVSMLLETRFNDSMKDISMEEDRVSHEKTDYVPMDLDETIPTQENNISMAEQMLDANINQCAENMNNIEKTSGGDSMKKESVLDTEETLKTNGLLIDFMGSMRNQALAEQKIQDIEETNISKISLELEKSMPDVDLDISPAKDVKNTEIVAENSSLVPEKRRATIYFEADIEQTMDEDKIADIADISMDKENSGHSEGRQKTSVIAKPIEQLHKTIYFEEDIDQSVSDYDDGAVTSSLTNLEPTNQVSKAEKRKTVYIYEPIADLTLQTIDDKEEKENHLPTERSLISNKIAEAMEKGDDIGKSVLQPIEDNLIISKPLLDQSINKSTTKVLNLLTIPELKKNIMTTHSSSSGDDQVEDRKDRRGTIYKEMSMDISMTSMCDERDDVEKKNVVNQSEGNELLMENSQRKMHSDVMECENMYETPKKDSDNQKRLKNLYQPTPSQSVIEFMEVERRMAIIKDGNNTPTFTTSGNCMKRLSVNLTPCMPPGKKSQNTTLYRSTNMEETLMDDKTLCYDNNGGPTSITQTDIQNETNLSNTMAVLNQTEEVDSRKSIYISQITFMDDNVDDKRQQQQQQLEYCEDSNLSCSMAEQVINLDSSSCTVMDDNVNGNESMDDVNQSNLLKSIQVPRRYTVNDQTLQLPVNLPQQYYEDLNEITDKSNHSDFSKVSEKEKKEFLVDCHVIESKIEDDCLSDTKQIWKRIRESLPPTSIDASKMCRTCKCCRKTLENDSTIVEGNFELPPVPSLAEIVGLERLRKSSKGSHLEEVDGLWRSLELKGLDRTNLSRDEMTFSNSPSQVAPETKGYRSQSFIENYQATFERLKKNVRKSNCSLQRPSYMEQLAANIKKFFPKWIFDYQMQRRGILLLHHRDILTFSLRITIKELDYFGKTAYIKSVGLCERISERQWYPIDYILHFQCKLEIPFEKVNNEGYKTVQDMMEWLKMMDDKFHDTILLVKELQRVVLLNEASFIRVDNRTCICKTIRLIVPDTETYDRVEEVQFKITVYNVRKLSFRNISMPPLHRFCEEIHCLPIGVDFISPFFNNPLMYLKNSNIQS